MFELREELEAFYTEQSNPKADKFCDIFWVAKLAYLLSIFDRLNQLNISLQGKGGDNILVNKQDQCAENENSTLEKQCFV